ncbi:hypothetical protein NUW58_g5386 [Xylaria curta]|uniref:Uncharacterized protein n=1 Tax=Xylaria curta TaxID=42375 RepID=A0ACC1P4A4_9PEZI|nr:hypothetical protein NUW58_g5386 [Xylaria curta]
MPHHFNSRLLRTKSFHFLASPDELEDQVSMLLRLRQEQDITQRPLIVWESAPLSCNIANLASHFNACALVDVFSPNHLELGYLVDGESLHETEFSPSAVESQAGRFLAIGVGPNREGLVLIRSGEHGVLFASSKDKANWLPAYYKNNGSGEIVDPTGAGNTFLGAFTVALQETKDPREACLRESVAASYALEQFGPAKLTASWLSKELWNGSCVQSRLRDFKARIPAA